jgi:chemosensory pili system protein ChpC
MALQLASNNEVQDISTLLIPLDGRTLLLPNVSIAEILDFSEPTRVPDVPTWYLGDLQWRTLHVPLISIEALCERPFGQRAGNAKIAIMNGVVDNPRLSFWGLVTQGAPRQMRIRAEEIVSDEFAALAPGEYMSVVVNGESAMIPDLDYIEKQLLAYRA